jgi:hypothetical protein
MYGTSARGALIAQVAAQLRKLKLPLPGAPGIFAVGGDASMTGDSEALFDLKVYPSLPNILADNRTTRCVCVKFDSSLN